MTTRRGHFPAGLAGAFKGNGRAHVTPVAVEPDACVY
jgi:hypothetical protein